MSTRRRILGRRRAPRPTGPQRKPRVGPKTAGALLLLIVAIGCFFAFTKRVPFKHHYEVTAVVRTSNLLAKGSPVRIAGVTVGSVVGTGRYRGGSDAEIVLRLKDGTRALRRDASLKIRPRLFLEGNFYVDLQPGTPDAPAMPDRGVIPVTRTSVPVQLDQVLTALQSDTRGALRETVQGLGDGVGSTPTAKEDASQDPAVRGLTGGQALNRTLASSPAALRDGTVALKGLRGRVDGDLSRAIDGLGSVTAGLARDESALRGAVRGFGTTVTATGDQADALRRTVSGLAETSLVGRTAFAQLRRALPPTRTAARDLTVAMRRTPATIDAARPWLRQAAPLLGRSELRGLLAQVRPGLADTARLTREGRALLPRVSSFTSCMNRVFLPTIKTPIQDGALTTGVPSHQEFWYGVVGLAGEGQTFDGNGTKLRLQAVGGATQIKTGYTNYSSASGGLPQFANLTQPSAGTSPAFSPVLPKVRFDVPCAKNGVPDLNGPASQGPGDGSAPSARTTPRPDLSIVPGSDR